MNQLEGKVIKVESSSDLALMDIEVNGALFSSIIIGLNGWLERLKPGFPVRLLFKETEVGIGDGLAERISIRNVFRCKIKEIRQSEILSEVTFDFKGFEIVSLITTRSVKKLDLKKGEEKEWFIKSTEVSVQEVSHER